MDKKKLITRGILGVTLAATCLGLGATQAEAQIFYRDGHRYSRYDRYDRYNRYDRYRYPYSYGDGYRYRVGGWRRDWDGDGIRNRRDRDRDNDGIRNRWDRDKDGDGIPNRRDRHPRNPRRR